MDFLRIKVQDWVEQGFVALIPTTPRCVNPFSVVSKLDQESGILKKRPVIDLSRCINKLTRSHPFTMDTLANCESSVMIADYQIIFDLENMYFHFQLHNTAKKFFTFTIPTGSGSFQYYQFNVMCYGYSLAAYVATRVITSIKAFLHKLGIRLSIYIHDGRVLAQTADECRFKAKLVIHVFQLCGFNIQ